MSNIKDIMMRYYHSNIYKSKNWLETDATDPKKVIEDYYYDRCEVPDADVCGDATVHFVFFINGVNVYYVLSYSWYIDYEPEWCINNDHYVEEVSEPTYKFPGDRDWINV